MPRRPTRFKPAFATLEGRCLCDAALDALIAANDLAGPMIVAYEAEKWGWEIWLQYEANQTYPSSPPPVTAGPPVTPMTPGSPLAMEMPE